MMTQRENFIPTARRLLVPRRIVLMASVAGLGMAALATGPGFHGSLMPPSLTSSALAADVMPQPSGFADLVAKVKPAVISVRVKFDGAAKTASSNPDEDNTSPFEQGTPFEKFFREFGFKDMPNSRPQAMPQPRQRTAAEGSGFFISADGYAVTNNHVVDNAKNRPGDHR